MPIYVSTHMCVHMSRHMPMHVPMPMPIHAYAYTNPDTRLYTQVYDVCTDMHMAHTHPAGMCADVYRHLREWFQASWNLLTWKD